MVSKHRNHGLDIVRAVSILLVLRAHRFPHNYEWGILGVQIFFVLSGFLIGQILIKDFKKEGDISTVINFWKRRWFRTLALYYLVLTLKIFFYGNPYGWKILVYFIFLQGNLVGIDFFPVSWSLVVEEWFYLFLPLSTLIFFSNGIQEKRYVIFLIAWIIFFFLWRILWNFLGKGLIIYQFDCLLLGVLASLCKLRFEVFFKSLSHPILLISSVVGIVFMTFILGDISRIPVYSPFYRVAWNLIISLLVILALPYIVESSFINQKLVKIAGLSTFFKWTSILTYAMYLIHVEVFKIHFQIPALINTLVQIVVLYGGSLFIYTFFEHPMTSLRDRFALSQYIKAIKSMG